MYRNVLRIGLIVSGRMFCERLFKERRTVTAGESGQADMAFPVGADVVVPARHELFKLSTTGGQYVLQVTADMTGRLSEGNTGQSVELSVLKAKADRKNGFFQIPLTDQSRGKIMIGMTTVLFQFVHVPPPKPGEKPRGLFSQIKAAFGGG